MPLFAFPHSPHPDAKTFNYCTVFFAAIFIIGLPWYYFYAYKWFNGPGEAHRPVNERPLGPSQEQGNESGSGRSIEVQVVGASK
jgi:hypothetical protein